MGEGEWIAAPLTQRQLQHKVRAGRGVTLQLQRVLSRQCALREVGQYSLRRTHFRVGSTIGGAPPMLGECGLRSADGRVGHFQQARTTIKGASNGRGRMMSGEQTVRPAWGGSGGRAVMVR